MLGQHVDATPSDLDLIAALNIEKIVDLRGNHDGSCILACAHESFRPKSCFLRIGETAGSGNAPHIEAARDVATAEQAHAAMVRLYALMPFRPKLVEVLRLYFGALAESTGATLLHCLAGKDRTGLAAALLHRLVGVHQDHGGLFVDKRGRKHQAVLRQGREQLVQFWSGDGRCRYTHTHVRSSRIP